MRTGGRSDSLSVKKLLTQRSEVILYSGATDLTWGKTHHVLEEFTASFTFISYYFWSIDWLHRFVLTFNAFS